MDGPSKNVRWIKWEGAWVLVISGFAAFSFCSILLLLAGTQPLTAYFHILKGSLGSWNKFSHVIQVWIPLTLCSCGLLYTFRIQLWNIGVEGQMIMGAVFATGVLRAGAAGSNPNSLLFLSFAAAIAGGSLWAVFAGFLKTRGGVHEIFAGLGLNFLAQGITLWLIFGPWKRPGVASMSGTEIFPAPLWLSQFSGIRISPLALALTIAVLLLTAIFLKKTRAGLALYAIGDSPAAAFLFGLKPDRYLLIAMTAAGGFAGIAGCIQVVAVYHRLIPAISSNYGYLALLVVMLSNYRLFLTPAVAFFFACLNVGSIQLPMVLRLDSSLSGVIQGSLVLAVLAANAWHRRQISRGKVS